MAFKPVVHRCEVTERDETLVFYVREPSGREMLNLAGDAKKTKVEKSALENARDLFSRYIVNEDGSKINDAEVEGYLEMRLTAMHKVSNVVQDKIGLTALTEKNA